MNNLRFYPCDAGDHAVALLLDEDLEIVYLEIFVNAFYSDQDSFLTRWKRRLEIILSVLRGKDYLFNEIVLSPEQVAAMSADLEEFKKAKFGDTVTFTTGSWSTLDPT